MPSYKISIPNNEKPKYSNKRYGVINCYAANTNQGIVRNYNEDRISIILNIVKPQSRANENWPKCSYFGVYDGHGGAACADYLRDRLHQFIIKDPAFPKNPKEALRNGFLNAEKKFMEICQNDGVIIDKSGSCAIACLIVDNTCYIANVGDSRAVLSVNRGRNIYALSKDHKPNDDDERARILKAGGKIYQSTVQRLCIPNQLEEALLGPHRVLPGRLSVSRTFGDAEAKTPSYGGNAQVIVCDPDIKSFKITKDHDFIILASMNINSS
jgi:protein phosphatase 2C family protein 2/3